jgi:hypothetical protein
MLRSGADQDVRLARTDIPPQREPASPRAHTATRPHHPEQGNLVVLLGFVTV